MGINTGSVLSMDSFLGFKMTMENYGGGKMEMKNFAGMSMEMDNALGMIVKIENAPIVIECKNGKVTNTLPGWESDTTLSASKNTLNAMSAGLSDIKSSLFKSAASMLHMFN
jgi:hypothetical protein